MSLKRSKCRSAGARRAKWFATILPGSSRLSRRPPWFVLRKSANMRICLGRHDSAAAEQDHASQLLKRRPDHGQVFAGVRIVNPFLKTRRPRYAGFPVAYRVVVRCAANDTCCFDRVCLHRVIR